MKHSYASLLYSMRKKELLHSVSSFFIIVAKLQLFHLYSMQKTEMLQFKHRKTHFLLPSDVIHVISCPCGILFHLTIEHTCGYTPQSFFLV